MAEKNPAPKKKRFEIVTASHKVSGGALRDDPEAKVNPSGLTNLNRGATDLLDELAGTTADTYPVFFGADTPTRTVAVYMATGKEPGAMMVRRYHGKGGTRISFHMGGVWKQHPKLRPESTMEYKVKLDTDEDGVPYLEIQMQAGLNERKGTRTTTDPEAEI